MTAPERWAWCLEPLWQSTPSPLYLNTPECQAPDSEFTPLSQEPCSRAFGSPPKSLPAEADANTRSPGSPGEAVSLHASCKPRQRQCVNGDHTPESTRRRLWINATRNVPVEVPTGVRQRNHQEKNPKSRDKDAETSKILSTSSSTSSYETGTRGHREGWAASRNCLGARPGHESEACRKSDHLGALTSIFSSKVQGNKQETALSSFSSNMEDRSQTCWEDLKLHSVSHRQEASTPLLAAQQSQSALSNNQMGRHTQRCLEDPALDFIDCGGIETQGPPQVRDVVVQPHQSQIGSPQSQLAISELDDTLIQAMLHDSALGSETENEGEFHSNHGTPESHMLDEWIDPQSNWFHGGISEEESCSIDEPVERSQRVLEDCQELRGAEGGRNRSQQLQCTTEHEDEEQAKELVELDKQQKDKGRSAGRDDLGQTHPPAKIRSDELEQTLDEEQKEATDVDHSRQDFHFEQKDVHKTQTPINQTLHCKESHDEAHTQHVREDGMPVGKSPLQHDTSSSESEVRLPVVRSASACACHPSDSESDIALLETQHCNPKGQVSRRGPICASGLSPSDSSDSGGSAGRKMISAKDLLVRDDRRSRSPSPLSVEDGAAAPKDVPSDLKDGLLTSSAVISNPLRPSWSQSTRGRSRDAKPVDFEAAVVDAARPMRSGSRSILQAGAGCLERQMICRKMFLQERIAQRGRPPPALQGLTLMSYEGLGYDAENDLARARSRSSGRRRRPRSLKDGSPSLEPLKPSEHGYRIATPTTRNEELHRSVQSLLNKISPSNLSTIVEQMADVSLKTVSELELVVGLIFQKALSESHYSETYADMVIAMRAKCPEFFLGDEGETPVTFTRVLLTTCQREFESLPEKLEPDAAEVTGLDPIELETIVHQRKGKLLAYMKFLGNLFLRRLLSVKIIEQVLLDLVGGPEDDEVPDEPFVECACELLQAVGYTLELSQNGRALAEQSMSRLSDLHSTTVYSKRLRFLIQDILDLRENSWERKVFREVAKTMDDIRRDAVKDAQSPSGTCHRTARAGVRPSYLDAAKKIADENTDSDEFVGEEVNRRTIPSPLASPNSHMPHWRSMDQRQASSNALQPRPGKRGASASDTNEKDTGTGQGQSQLNIMAVHELLLRRTGGREAVLLCRELCGRSRNAEGTTLRDLLDAGVSGNAFLDTTAEAVVALLGHRLVTWDQLWKALEPLLHNNVSHGGKCPSGATSSAALVHRIFAHAVHEGVFDNLAFRCLPNDVDAAWDLLVGTLQYAQAKLGIDASQKAFDEFQDILEAIHCDRRSGEEGSLREIIASEGILQEQR
eukprot:gnl/MRDRNA2_/MRDRNA2_71914_c0_seq1.p1 gnl/MRDRNA2_/MRDRNA2_71914_c0~~gnl/MRDRNA2_/MRDRNA2_71914_c0_seq1.p1  ORF type:complete len:1309 (+),score=235.98 gnl/MRDRNA2_/MRDRNA2_71914_c0_seq1:133-4059(+)